APRPAPTAQPAARPAPPAAPTTPPAPRPPARVPPRRSSPPLSAPHRLIRRPESGPCRLNAYPFGEGGHGFGTWGSREPAVLRSRSRREDRDLLRHQATHLPLEWDRSRGSPIS